MNLKRLLPFSLILLLVFAGCVQPEESDLPENLKEDIMSLPPLKDSFSAHFSMIGNIFNPNDVNAGGTAVTNTRLTRHFNILTAENSMKPSELTRNGSVQLPEGQYNFSTADRMVNAALASNIKVVGHTLLWHSQIPQWQRNLASASKETALAAMKEYITDVVTHYKGQIYSWDVLNEVFPDGVRADADWKTSMRSGRQGNPWFLSIGSDFVYEGFLAARLADPDAILYYNDYNTDQVGKATMIRNMVRDVNAKYKQAYPNETRLLIEGIGMQEHHNTGVSAKAVENTIKLFRPLGVKLSVSELDVLGQSWSEYSSSAAVTSRGLEQQARLYRDLFRLYIENSDIIERVTLWGVTDNRSWRSAGLPLLFDASGKAKLSYYAVIDALK